MRKPSRSSQTQRGRPGGTSQSAKKSDKITRLLRVITLIHGNPGIDLARLVQELGMTQRTVHRDIRTLRDAQVPIDFNPELGGYSIRRDFFLPPIQLTLDEAMAICTLGEQIGRGTQIPYLGAVSRAVEKIRGQLPQAVHAQLGEAERRHTVRLAARAPGDDAADVYQRVRQAILDRRALLCTYESPAKTDQGPSKSSEPFRFDPYRLLFEQRAWYVIGRHHGHNEIRCLRLSRFIQCTASRQPYVIDESFSLDGYLGNAWRLIRGKQRYHVRVHFDKRFADGVCSTQWHKSQTQESAEDGGEILSFDVDGLEEIVWWVLSMGPHAKVLAPRELADRVRELAAQTARRYS